MSPRPLLMRVLRTLRGVSQESIAQQIGKSTPCIAQIERGALDPSLDVRRKLAAAFGNIPTPLLFHRVDPEIIEEASALMIERVRASVANHS